MQALDSILKAIGHTPLVKLGKVVGPGDATVLVKPEFLNPGGSIKDRMALFILEKAEREGKLKPGGTIVENTSGNTGYPGTRYGDGSDFNFLRYQKMVAMPNACDNHSPTVV